MEEKPAPIEDRLDPARAAALWSLLGLEGPPPGYGDPLPALFHYIYFWSVPGWEKTSNDGHSSTGLIPDLGLPRRMLAGGKLVFHAPMKLGIAAEKSSIVRAVTRKEGRTGKLGFVTLRHEIRQRGALVLTEDQDIVFREAHTPGEVQADGPVGDPDPTISCAHHFDPVALFRYSALTMNAHRIHYDEPYAKTEGYGNLVVQGPFLAQLLASLAESQIGRLSAFEFRATSPLVLGSTAKVCAKGGDFWVESADRRVVMTARAV